MDTDRSLCFLILAVLGASVLLGCARKTPTPTAGPASPTAVPKPTVAATPPDGGRQTPGSSAQDPVPVWVIVADQVTALDPHQMVSIHPEGSIASHIWDTLTWIDANLEVQPHLAESWRLVNDFTWEFELRPGITFHNGEPLDARAVRFSIERARSMPGSLETFAQDVDLEKVEIVSDYVLRIVTRRPEANVPYHLAFLEILPPVYYSETSSGELSVSPIGSGPYQVEAWKPGEALVLRAARSYWRGEPHWSCIVFEAVPTASGRVDALRASDIALATDLLPIQAAQWDVTIGELKAMESVQRVVVGISPVEGGPLADKRVRQALNYAVDVGRIVDALLEGYGRRYGSWANLPDSELAPWPYDVDRARALMAEAGFPGGFETALYAPSGVYYSDVAIAQAIAQQLSEIGVLVEVEILAWDAYVREILSDDPPSLFLLAMNSRGNPLEDTRSLSAGFRFRPTRWRSERFEDLLGQAGASFNQDVRLRLLNEAQGVAYDDAPCIWLWRQYDFYGVGVSLEWVPRPDGLVYLYVPRSGQTEGGY
jgi:peptide/nickel transport system substrate-binding protein